MFKNLKQVFCRHREVKIVHIGYWRMTLECRRCGKHIYKEPGK